ncbi:MAG TPA: DinB family protein [Candidatus Acidoferrales bacterium]|nr:DinB family protein [Candidatus Acidoferrales bacterium]
MSAPQFTPEQARFILGLTLPAMKIEHETTKRVIQAIPVHQGDYRPDAVSKTASELAWHIVVAEKRFFNTPKAGAFDVNPIPKPESAKDSAGIVAWFDETFGESIEKLQQASADELTKIVDFRGIFQLPAVAFLQIGLNHTIHHRGQLSMYLRPMGAKVPSIYGESYDATQERMAREAKAT